MEDYKMNIFKKQKEISPKEDKRLEESAETIHNEKNIEEPAEEIIMNEEDGDAFTSEPAEITGDAPKTTYDKSVLLFQLAELVREMADAEDQLKQKRIYWKSEKNMTGLMTINEIITIAERLKYEIKKVGDVLIEECGLEDDALNNKIKDFSGDLKTYEFWLR